MIRQKTIEKVRIKQLTFSKIEIILPGIGATT
jgi:hypothetical protein